MKDSQTTPIAVEELRIGMFVHLDLGWMDHPFPLSSFKINSPQQLETLRSLGLKTVRYSPEKSDAPAPAADQVVAKDVLSPEAEARALAQAEAEQQRLARRAQLQAQKSSLLQCEKQFAEAARSYRQLVDEVDSNLAAARTRCEGVINGFLQQMLGDGDAVIRLLSEGLGDRAALHSVNVTVLCLLLGKAMGLSHETLGDLGRAAMLHDMGKQQLPDRVRFREDHFTPAEHKLYQSHVGHGAMLGKQLGLSVNALLGISQHHEMADGTGFPLGLKDDKIGPLAKILALVNRYDNLCNPGNPSGALTPHEALSLIFAQMKTRFDTQTLGAFIRMMGVYPPGSVVQLVDARYAMVVSVNSSRPLRPRIIVHEPSVPKDEALILDLEQAQDLGIKRSVRPLQLPKATIDYLSPRQRICYFFERAADPLVVASGA
ncbi:HD-GYP domain-containing protein [Hydrogenophaga sp. OTU3427]|uniref:HD-GYP domain-containing protein n=1 Tax=Hydrogenophaga sp. OTU3427 TaxID=3043856 RepID=UPI00313BCB38